MKRISWIALSAVIASLGAPSVAFAAEQTAVVSPLRIAVSLGGLIVAVVLLLEALRVRKVASGGIIADRISYVILAIVCLAGSALAQWVQNFVVDVTQEQMQLVSQLLVIAAMGLLAAYFFSIRSALQSYLSTMTGAEMLASDAETGSSSDSAEEA
jgi:hypothetical protein